MYWDYWETRTPNDYWETKNLANYVMGNYGNKGHEWLQNLSSTERDFLNNGGDIPFSTPEPETLPNDYDINDNPQLTETYEYIKQGVPVIFLTGGAGTGKSTFIKYIRKNSKSEMNKNCIVLAPTGVAAINVGGQTIHSFFGFKTDIFEDYEIRRLAKNSVIDHTDLIIIDEISMVSSWMLDHIDFALRLWCEKKSPFGGKQVLLIGDCFQLPPVQNTNDFDAMNYYSKWESSFFFAAKVFSNASMKAVQLKRIYRQKDDKTFIHMLNRIRKCEAGYKNDIELLNDKCLIEKRLGTKNVPEECLLLTTKNADAEKFNTIKMNTLKQNGETYKTFEGMANGKFNFDHFLTPKSLELCIGAKVMVTKNIPSQNLVNGDMGRVISFGNGCVVIRTKSGEHILERQIWQSIRYKWNSNSKTISQETEGTFIQIPLILGWAVTIHKSQGLTLDSVAIDAADAWDSGQVYVALSRARTLNGILLRQKIPVSAIKANPYIKLIYDKLFPESEKENAYNAEEYKEVCFDNSEFTVDRTAEKTGVTIGGLDFELFPMAMEKIQDHVKRTMTLLLRNNLIPEEEMYRLLNDKEYCYETFGICFNFKTSLLKFTLLVQKYEERLDDYGRARYWKDQYSGYYICSQWYQSCAPKFAAWLIKLSREVRSPINKTVYLIKKGSNARIAVQTGNLEETVSSKEKVDIPSLFAAAESNDSLKMQEILQTGININAKDKEGWTALMRSVAKNSVDTIQQLIDAGANVEEKDIGGWTALMEAAFNNYTNVAKILIAAGAKIEVANQSGYTALMWAAQNNSIGVAALLINEGARLTTRNKYGQTALDIAKESDAEDVEELLYDAGAK